MTKYQNKRNGRIAVVVEHKDNYKTTMLEYVDDGKTTVVTDATLKRWWKKLPEEAVVEQPSQPEVDEQYVAEVMRQKDELGIECPPITQVEVVSEDTTDGGKTPLPEVGKEIAEQAKAKAEAVKKVRKAKEMTQVTKDSMQFVLDCVKEFGDEIFVPAKEIGLRTFKVGGHMYAKFNFSKSSITLAVKGIVLDGQNVREPSYKLNHMFDSVYKFNEALTDEDKVLIKSLLTLGRDYRISKNTKNKEEQ